MIHLIYRKFGNRLHAKDDVLSGLTVALALVPEAVAFALIAGVHPLVGLYAAFMVGLLTSIFGGRPGMISGATGAMAVVMVALVREGNIRGEEMGLGPDMGVQFLFATVVFTGVIQMLCGVLKLGRFVRLVPQPVMFGFVNGLAIVIFQAQFSMFKTDPTDPASSWLSGGGMVIMLVLVGLTMGLIHFFPKLTKAVPSSLVAILVVSGLAIGLGLDTLNVGNMASIAGGLPTFGVPDVPFTWDSVSFILPYAFILAAIGLIESLMTLVLIDELTETRGNSNRECLGQGFANLVTGFFGGMGGCAMIGQSIINIRSGGRTRLSGIVAAVSLLLFILFASPLIEKIPLAALTGVMFMVVIGTFEWSSFRILHRIPKIDALVLVLVSGVTVFTHNLALAVLVGIVISALAFAYKASHHVYHTKEDVAEGRRVYHLEGPLFFGSVMDFSRHFNPVEDPEDVVIDFRNSRVWDHSGLEAIQKIAERYREAGKTIHLQHLSPECRELLKKAGTMVDIIVLPDDPTYRVANIRITHEELEKATAAGLKVNVDERSNKS